jgi:hypothetical protein
MITLEDIECMHSADSLVEVCGESTLSVLKIGETYSRPTAPAAVLTACGPRLALGKIALWRREIAEAAETEPFDTRQLARLAEVQGQLTTADRARLFALTVIMSTPQLRAWLAKLVELSLADATIEVRRAIDEVPS